MIGSSGTCSRRTCVVSFSTSTRHRYEYVSLYDIPGKKQPYDVHILCIRMVPSAVEINSSSRSMPSYRAYYKAYTKQTAVVVRIDSFQKRLWPHIRACTLPIVRSCPHCESGLLFRRPSATSSKTANKTAMSRRIACGIGIVIATILCFLLVADALLITPTHFCSAIP